MKTQFSLKLFIAATLLISWSSVFADGKPVSLGDADTTLIDAELISQVAIETLSQVESRIPKPIENHTHLQKIIRELSYKMVYSRKVVTGLTASIFFNHPELILVDPIYRTIRNAVIFKALVASGNAYLIPFVPLAFDPEAMDFLYVKLKKWYQKKKNEPYFVKNFGLTGAQLEKEKIKVLSSWTENSAEGVRIQMIQVEGENVIIPILEFRGKQTETLFPESLMTAKTLESMVDDKDFLRELALFQVYPHLRNQILLEKIMMNDSSRAQLLSRIRKLSAPANKEVYEALIQIEMFSNRITAQIDQESKKASVLRNLIPSRFAKVIRYVGLRMKLMNQLRSATFLQMKFLAASREKAISDNDFVAEWQSLRSEIERNLFEFQNQIIQMAGSREESARPSCQKVFTR